MRSTEGQLIVGNKSHLERIDRVEVFELSAAFKEEEEVSRADLLLTSANKQINNGIFSNRIHCFGFIFPKKKIIIFNSRKRLKMAHLIKRLGLKSITR